MNEVQLKDLFTRKYLNSNIDLCRDTMEHFVDSIIKVLFPALCNQSSKNIDQLKNNLSNLKIELDTILTCLTDELHNQIDKHTIIRSFFEELLELEKQMNEDANFILEGDPAAKNFNEVVICYPGFYAIAVYRLAHYFHNCELPLFARILTEYAHRKTGIDIHPGAKIKSPFFIDHGTGVVIGESTNIGKRVKIYQGVTLGATSVDKNLANTKRHPTIEDDVIIYSNATILGGKTTIGKNSIIGGNVWIVDSIPPNSKIFYKEH